MRYKERLVFLFIGAWFLCSFIGVYIYRILSTVDQQQQQTRIVFHRRDPGLGRQSGLTALRLWSRLVAHNETASRLTEEFLEEAMVSNRSKAVDLELIGELWKRFRSEFQGLESPILPRKLGVDELISWGHFVEYVKDMVSEPDEVIEEPEDINPVVVEYEDYSEPPYRALSKDILDLLLKITREMKEVRVPRNDLGERLNIHHTHKRKTEHVLPAWRRLQNHMRRHQLYSSTDPALDEVLHNLRIQPITGLEIKPDSGTQNKLFFRLKDGSRTLAKPKRMPIDIETPPERYQFDDFEKFYAEVASFHLDRIMGFNRVPPVVSRYINLTSEVRKFASYELEKTFYKSLEGDICFFGICEQFCDTPFAVCGTPDLIPVSMAFYLPSRTKVGRLSWENPWKQSYCRYERAPWEGDDLYCHRYVLSDDFFHRTRRLLDIIDMAVFDFIQGNLDRHHYHSFEVFQNDSDIFLYDNGRAFARAYRDDFGILMPLTQCCMIRFSTLERLLGLYLDRVSLGDKLRISLEDEIVRPLLAKRHLRAVNRRLVLVLEAVYDCITAADGDYKKVIRDDGY